MNRNAYIILAAALLACAHLAWGANVADGDIKTFQAGDTLKAGDMNQNFGALKQGVNTKQDRVSGTCTAGSAVKQINADGTVACESVAGGAGDITGVTPGAGSGITGGGLQGDVTLSIDTNIIQSRVSQSCVGNSAIKAVNANGSVACETILPPNPGDITAVFPGTGLSGGANSGDATLAVNPAMVQTRVSSNCAAGQAIRSVNENGTVACEVIPPGDITGVTAGAGLTGGGTLGDITLAVNTAAIQNRVTGNCVAGWWIREIKADGTVTCEPAAVTAEQWSTLQNTITSMQNTITALQTQLSAVQNSKVMDLEPYLSVQTVARVTTVTLSRANLQLVNGTGNTDSANGMGNLIIGYDTARDGTINICSDGQYANQTACEAAGKIWAVSHKSGSHYLVVGEQNNYSAFGGLVVGYRNTSNRDYASVSGGSNNTASGLWSSVSGGYENFALAGHSSVSGGWGNGASGDYSSVSGGSANTASGSRSSVSGGSVNTASATYSSVSGGYKNNTASGAWSSVSGGYSNTAVGDASSVSGGSGRSAIGQYDWAAGALFQDQ